MHRATVLALAEQCVRVQRDVRGALAGRGGVGRVVRARGNRRGARRCPTTGPQSEPRPARGDVAPPPSRSCDTSRARRASEVRPRRDVVSACDRGVPETALLAEPRNAASNGRIPDVEDDSVARFPRASSGTAFPRHRREGADTGVRTTPERVMPPKKERRRYHRRRRPRGAPRARLFSSSPLRSCTRTASSCRTSRCGRTLQGTLDQIVRGEMTRRTSPPSP